MLEIVHNKHPALHTIAPCVVDQDISDLLESMKSIVEKENALGIAAPQLGVSLRIIYVVTNAYIGFIINPEIDTLKSKTVKSKAEGCLSYPGKRKTMKRNIKCSVTGLNENNEPIVFTATKMDAFVIQHEIDHLNGITIL